MWNQPAAGEFEITLNNSMANKKLVLTYYATDGSLSSKTVTLTITIT
jgi:hypothetical protein